MPRVTVRDVGVRVCVCARVPRQQSMANGCVTRWQTGRWITGIQTGPKFTFLYCKHAYTVNSPVIVYPTNKMREGRQGLGKYYPHDFLLFGEYDRDQLPEEDPETIVNRLSGN